MSIRMVMGTEAEGVSDVVTGDEIPCEFREALVFRNRKIGEDAHTFKVSIKPHSFRVFTIQAPHR